MSRGVFVSYRRSDSQSATGRMCDHLRSNGFDADGALFLDIDNVPPGADFRQVIAETLDRCDVVLVVIGPSWSTARDTQGRRRLDMSSDTHRIEVESALNSGAVVIPVLVDGAQHPSDEELPEAISQLAFRNAWSLSHRGFAGDVAGLAEHIRRIRSERNLDQGHPFAQPQKLAVTTDIDRTVVSPGSVTTRGGQPRRGLLWGLGGLGVVALVVLGLAVGLSARSGGSGRDRAVVDTVAPTSPTTATSVIAEAPTTLAIAVSTDPPASTTAVIEEPTSTAPNVVELPERFATAVPVDECTRSAIARDTGRWPIEQRCLGRWAVSVLTDGSEVDVYRWNGTRWTYRGSRSLNCVANFVSLGMSIYEAGAFGANSKQTGQCQLEVNWLPEPPTGPLRRGDQGPRVEALQIRLANLGLLFTIVDDLFGLNTAAAVVDLKLLLGLATPDNVDGIADEEVLALIG